MKDTYYTATHEWVKFTDDTHATIGITDYAQHALGDIVFVNLPEIGDTVNAEQRFGDVESVKAVSDLISPIDGKVLETNEVLINTPETLNLDAPGTWILKVEGTFDKSRLLNKEQYDLLLTKEH
jgi:glycine cleavage system H protein